MRSVWGIWLLAFLVAASATSARAQGTDDPFYRGLEQRGLRTLMEAYLKQRETADARPGERAPSERDELALARLAVQNALAATNMAARDNAFKNARRLYEGAIADAKKAMAAIPADRIEDLNSARLTLLNVRLEMANMIFQKWLKTDLDLLEVTDRRGGDRARATELLGTATDLYTATLQDTQIWLSSLDQLPEDQRRKYVNSGQTRKVRNVQRESRFANAWILYYYGWILPKDYKPPKAGRKRDEILEDAITAFQAYTDMSDRASAKWYAYMVIGMAYRELGKYDEALQSFAMATPPKTDPKASEAVKQREAWKDEVRIRVAYERAITLMRRGGYKKARDAIDEAAERFKDKLNNDLYGLAMPIVKAESYILEGQSKNQEGLKDEGVKILKEVHKRDNPWPVIVQWVLSGLLGEQPAVERAPFQIWIEANEALDVAQKTENADKMREAEGLFKVYADKVGPKDTNYAAALYSRAACLLQLGDKSDAVGLFRKVGDEFPDYKYASAAASYAVGVAGEVYEKNQTEENRLAYEKALRWFISKYLQSDPDQQYYLALILYRGKDFINAADAFSRVPAGAEHYADSRYWVPVCRIEHFRENVLPTRNKALILSSARNVAKGLLAYADYAFGVQDSDLSDEKKGQLLDWAEAAYVNAADVYLYPEVVLPADALPILKAIEEKFSLSEEARGRVLKLRIDAHQRLGQLDEARKVLDTFLTIAKPEDVGPVLRGLFQAMIDDVRDLIKRQQKKLAGVKVEQAKALGDRYLQWLDKSGVADKATEIENTRYDLAELYLAVRNYGGALTIYQDIGGPKPDQVKRGELLKEDCVYGMARAHEGLGETAPGAAQAKPHFERSLELWRVLNQVENLQPNDWWERTYHLLYCMHRLGQKEEVRDSMKAIEIMRDLPNDPVFQKKWRELRGAVAG